MKKQESGFVSVTILVFAVLGILGYFVYEFFNTSPIGPIVIPSPFINKDWKTYINPVHNYSIQYPSEYTIYMAKDYNTPEDLVYFKSPKNILIGISYGDQGTLCANNNLPCDPVKFIKATIEGKMYEPIEQYYMNDTNNYNFNMQIDKQIDLRGTFSDKEDAIEVNQILSTFKFLDKTEGACFYNGKYYDVGDQFKAIDGCNGCTCATGQISCTEMACQ